MKRILIISLVVALAVVMMAVPAMAASYVGTDIYNDGFPLIVEAPVPGSYVSRVVSDFGVEGQRIEAFSEPFEWVEDFNYLDDEAMASHVVFDLNGEKITCAFGCWHNYWNTTDGESYYFLTVVDGAPAEYAYYLYEVELIPVDEFNGSGTTGSESVSPSPASIFVVFAGIGNWLAQALTDASSIFYQAESGLTLLGTLSVCGLGVAVVFLLFGWIRRMLLLRH